jgi:hypothetical protein
MSTALTKSREQEVVQELQQLSTTFQKASRTAVEAGVRIGELLTEVRGDTSKNWGFGAWVEEHCDFGRAMASRYMQAFENFRILSIQKMQIPATLTELAAYTVPPAKPTPLHAHMPSGLQHPPSPNP